MPAQFDFNLIFWCAGTLYMRTLAAIFLMRLIYLQIFLLTIGTVYSQADCNKYPDDYIPKDLSDALTYLTCTLPDKDMEEFKSKDEEDAVTELHMGTGLGIRNGWELWKGKNSLYRFFQTRGISHPDDISSIILTSFHRHLNKKDIDLENQIKYYKDYWKKAKEERKVQAAKKNEADKLEFEKFNIGDKVRIQFSQGNLPNNLLLHKIHKDPPPWEQNRICYVTGIVKKKKILKGNNYVLVIEATDICGQTMAYHGDGEKDNLIVGQTFVYSISYFNIEKA